MANLTRSGYLDTAQAVVWTSGQALNSAANNEWTDLADAVDNSTTKYMFADVEVVLASAAFTGAGSSIEVYLIPSVDGTNYPTWTGNVTTEEQENAGFFVGAVTTTGSTAAQRMVLRDVELPNGLFRWAFRNKGGPTLAASGNSASWRPHSVAS
jgi:hypothetical protein